MGRRRGKKLKKDKGEDEMIEGSGLEQPSSSANVEGVKDAVGITSLEGEVMGQKRGIKRNRDQEEGAGNETVGIEEPRNTTGQARDEDLESEGSSPRRVLRSRITGAVSSLSSVVTGPSLNENAIEKGAGLVAEVMDEKQGYKDVHHRVSLKCACGKAFTQNSRFAAHLVQNICGHPMARDVYLTCSCALIFATRQELREHVKSETAKLTQSSRYAMKLLTIKEVEENGDHLASLKCACLKFFPTSAGLASHVNHRHCDHPAARESYLTCTCKLRFETRSLLMQHVKTEQAHGLRKATPAKLSDNRSNSVLEDSMKRDNSMSTDVKHGKNWTCICHLRFVKDANMGKHIGTNHFDTPDANTHYKTCKCGLIFSTRDALNKHILQEQQSQSNLDVPKKMYKCQLCNDPLSSAQNLREHFAAKHSSSPKTAKYQCPVNTCLQLINTMTEFRSHVSNKHLITCGKLICCPCCLSTFRGLGKLFRHVSKHHQPLIYKSARKDIPCPMCDSTIKKENLMNHFKSEHDNLNTRPNICIRCGLELSHRHILHRHVFKLHKDDVELSDWYYTCKEETCRQQCNNAVGLRVHMKNIHPSKNLKCYRCTDVFCTKNELNRHYSLTHVQRRNTKLSSARIRNRYTFKRVKKTCDGCQKEIGQQHFSRHLRTVHCQDLDLLYKYYKCPQKDCLKICRIPDLSHHINLHKWQCPTRGCYVKLRSKQALMKHLNEDKLDKVVYKCSKCAKVFLHRKSRVEHEQVCTETSTIIRFVLARNCERGFCNEQHAKGEDMSSHILESHISKGDGYQCRLCGRQYLTKSTLFKHLRNFHENHLAMTSLNYQKMHVFEVLATYKTNRITPINLNKYTCRICQRGFAYRNCLLWHLRNSHHQGVLLKKDEVEMMDSDQLDLTCNVCCRIFPCLFSLYRHQKQKHPHAKKENNGGKNAKLGSVFWCPCCQFNPSVAPFNADPFQWQMKPTEKSEVPILMACTRCDFVARSLEKAFLHVKRNMKKDYDAYPAPEEGLVGPKSFHHCATCNKLFSTSSAYLMHLELLHWEEYKKELIRLKPEFKGHPFLNYYYPD